MADKTHWIVIDDQGYIFPDDNAFSKERDALDFVEEKLGTQECEHLRIYKLTHECDLVEYDPEVEITKVKQ